MRLLPKLPYAGRMARLSIDQTIEQCLGTATARLGGEFTSAQIPNSNWIACWIQADKLRGRGFEANGQKAHPFLVRYARRTKVKNDIYLDHLEEEEKRFLFLGLDADIVDDVLEAGDVGGQLVTPRIKVDLLVHYLVSPPEEMKWPLLPDGKETPPEKRVGRPYLLGSLYAAIGGYRSDLKNISFFGENLADAKLFEEVRDKLSVHRVGVRTTEGDKKEILSISNKGEVALQTFRGASHLNAIDIFTQFLRANSLIDWKESQQ